MNRPNFRQPQSQHRPVRTRRVALEMADRKPSIFRPILALVLILATFILVYFIYLFTTQVGSGTTQSSVRKRAVQQGQRAERWWDEEYSANIKLSVSNVSGDKSLLANQSASVSIDHAQLIKNKLSTFAGTDMKLVYLDVNNKYELIDFTVENPGSATATVKFKLFYDVEPNSTDDFYYLYFGNFFKPEPFRLAGNLTPAKTESYKIGIGETKVHPLLPTISRRWVIKGGPTIPESFKTSEIRYTPSPDLQLGADVTVRLLNQYSQPLKDLKMTKDPANGSYFYRIGNSDFEANDYLFRLIGNVDGQSRSSPRQEFHVSYPLYLNWSIDWEGYAIEDRWLNMLNQVANDFGIAPTHYFNPRIYISDSASRQKYLTDWVLNRQRTYGDEIGLHLHMWTDLVSAAGVTPKTEPSWAGNGTGYDVPTSSYSPEEFDKMIKWGKAQFAAHGLPEPKTYRAGGWQINSQQLKVLSENGFNVDSSGRNFTKFGKNQMPVPWFLSGTTKPYIPSLSDQNKSGKDSTNIWEFPINGDNSSNYGKDSVIVLENFRLNYDGSALTDKQTLCVLSHVQLFHNDEPIMRRFFTEVQKNLAKDDNGPVIYTSIQNVLPEYKQ